MKIWSQKASGLSALKKPHVHSKPLLRILVSLVASMSSRLYLRNRGRMRSAETLWASRSRCSISVCMCEVSASQRILLKISGSISAPLDKSDQLRLPLLVLLLSASMIEIPPELQKNRLMVLFWMATHWKSLTLNPKSSGCFTSYKIWTRKLQSSSVKEISLWVLWIPWIATASQVL